MSASASTVLGRGYLCRVCPTTKWSSSSAIPIYGYIDRGSAWHSVFRVRRAYALGGGGRKMDWIGSSTRRSGFGEKRLSFALFVLIPFPKSRFLSRLSSCHSRPFSCHIFLRHIGPSILPCRKLNSTAALANPLLYWDKGERHDRASHNIRLS